MQCCLHLDAGWLQRLTAGSCAGAFRLHCCKFDHCAAGLEAMTGSCDLKGTPVPALTAALAAQVESWHPCPHIPGCICGQRGRLAAGLVRRRPQVQLPPRPHAQAWRAHGALLANAAHCRTMLAPRLRVRQLPWSTGICTCACPALGCPRPQAVASAPGLHAQCCCIASSPLLHPGFPPHKFQIARSAKRIELWPPRHAVTCDCLSSV